MLANLNRAIALARRQHMPVIFIQHDSGPGSDLARDSEAWRLHPALARQDGDAVVHKRFSDSFQHTTLTELLRGDDIDELWLAGSATEFCVDSTLRSAMSQEYSVTLIADAHTCKPRPQLNAEQVIDHFNWVWSIWTKRPSPYACAASPSWKAARQAKTAGHARRFLLLLPCYFNGDAAEALAAAFFLAAAAS